MAIGDTDAQFTIFENMLNEATELVYLLLTMNQMSDITGHPWTTICVNWFIGKNIACGQGIWKPGTYTLYIQV